MPTYVVINSTFGEEWAEIGFDAADDTDAQTKLPHHLPNWIPVSNNVTCKRTEVDALRYYPRMARPQVGFSPLINVPGPGPLFKSAENSAPPLPHDAGSLSSSMNQLTVLMQNLEEIFRSIEPDQANMHVFGPLIRNTLLLAAMEFENECKGVLEANGYTPASARWSTADFIKVLGPLRLEEFDVKLAFYPVIASRKPFQGWNPHAPTRSLPWYDAYNAVKHDRERQFHRATIEFAIDAVTACAIMLAAEYRAIPNWGDQIGAFFNFIESPKWTPEQRYVWYSNAGGWQALRFPF